MTAIYNPGLFNTVGVVVKLILTAITPKRVAEIFQKGWVNMNTILSYPFVPENNINRKENSSYVMVMGPKGYELGVKWQLEQSSNYR